MAQTETSFETDLDPPRRKPAILRWVIRGLTMTCGLMIGLVILSEPRIAAQVEVAVERVRLMLEPDRAPQTAMAAEIRPAPAEKAEKPERKPTVSRLPQSRVPVRRVGAGHTD